MVPKLNPRDFVDLLHGAAMVYCAASVEEVQQDDVYHLILDDSAASHLLRMFFEEQDRLVESLPGEAAPKKPRSAKRERLRLRELVLLSVTKLVGDELLKEVRFDRSKTLAGYDPDAKTLWLGGDHPHLRALTNEVSCDSEEGGRRVQFLTAHALGLMNRELGSLEDADELNALKHLAAGP